ncbi:hypothetical protein D9M71_731460 [compost metagenome]
MTVIVGVGEQIRGIACQGVQFLELKQGEDGKKDVMVLALASLAFGVLGWEKPSSLI